MTPWQWWAGEVGDVDAEGVYALGEFATRDEAVTAAQREYPAGTDFYMIEARSSEALEHEGADMIPFLRTRNREVMTVPTPA